MLLSKKTHKTYHAEFLKMKELFIYETKGTSTSSDRGWGVDYTAVSLPRHAVFILGMAQDIVSSTFANIQTEIHLHDQPIIIP